MTSRFLEMPESPALDGLFIARIASGTPARYNPPMSDLPRDIDAFPSWPADSSAYFNYEFGYDGLGRRVWTQSNSGNGSWFIYDGDQLVQERDYRSDALIVEYAWGPTTGAPAIFYQRRLISGTPQERWIYTSPQGAFPRHLFDDTGAITDTFQYSSFGELVFHDGSTEVDFGYEGGWKLLTEPTGITVSLLANDTIQIPRLATVLNTGYLYDDRNVLMFSPIAAGTEGNCTSCERTSISTPKVEAMFSFWGQSKGAASPRVEVSLASVPTNLPGSPNPTTAYLWGPFDPFGPIVGPYIPGAAKIIKRIVAAPKFKLCLTFKFCNSLSYEVHCGIRGEHDYCSCRCGDQLIMYCCTMIVARCYTIYKRFYGTGQEFQKFLLYWLDKMDPSGLVGEIGIVGEGRPIATEYCKSLGSTDPTDPRCFERDCYNTDPCCPTVDICWGTPGELGNVDCDHVPE